MAVAAVLVADADDVLVALLESGDRLPDPVQAEAVASLDTLHRQLVERHASPWYRGWPRRRPPPRGRYLWGGVGRGKTWLMHLFYESLPTDRKLRVHFHRFMVLVHRELKKHPNQQDPLEIVARDMQHYSTVVLRKLSKIKGVSATRSSFVLEEIKSLY